jgi:hypothetical protein
MRAVKRHVLFPVDALVRRAPVLYVPAHLTLRELTSIEAECFYFMVDEIREEVR